MFASTFIFTLNHRSHSRYPRRVSEISTISSSSYTNAAGPSRFEIVKRQLEQQRKLTTESQYYMQTVPSQQIALSNIYESSSQSPYSDAPTRPASYAQVMKTKLDVIDQEPEPENYYSNVELMFEKN